MTDTTTGPEPEVASALSPNLHGYCARCGTWDAHGFTCSSCGYEFTSDADDVDQLD